MILIDNNFITGIISYIFDIFDNLKILIFLMIGIFLGFYIIERIVGIFRGEKETELEEEIF